MVRPIVSLPPTLNLLERILRHKEQKKISSTKLAALLKTTQSRISKIESGKIRLKLDTITHLCRALRLPDDEKTFLINLYHLICLQERSDIDESYYSDRLEHHLLSIKQSANTVYIYSKDFPLFLQTDAYLLHRHTFNENMDVISAYKEKVLESKIYDGHAKSIVLILPSTFFRTFLSTLKTSINRILPSLSNKPHPNTYFAYSMQIRNLFNAPELMDGGHTLGIIFEHWRGWKHPNGEEIEMMDNSFCLFDKKLLDIDFFGRFVVFEENIIGEFRRMIDSALENQRPIRSYDELKAYINANHKEYSDLLLE